MRISYDIAQEMTKDNITTESEYITFCEESLRQREYIKTLCSRGCEESLT